MRDHLNVDAYLEESDLWRQEIEALRGILLASGLDEQIKWGKPCYVHGGANIAIVQEFNDFLALMFFKGALMEDPAGVLEDQGPNTRSARRMTFTSITDVEDRALIVQEYLAEAMDVEDAELAVEPDELVFVDELRRRLDGDPAMRAAFEALTPGRQREYNLFISGAKQSATREARIDRNLERILAGKGLRDR